MRKEMERRNRGLRMGIAQFPPEFVWCCLQGQTAPPGSRDHCWAHTSEAPGRKLWGMWPEESCGLSEQLFRNYLVFPGQASSLMTSRI